MGRVAFQYYRKVEQPYYLDSALVVQVIEWVLEDFATEVVVEVVEVEVQGAKKSLPDFEDTAMDTKDTLEID